MTWKGLFLSDGKSLLRMALSVGRSVCLQKIFKKFLKRGFVNPIDMRLVSTYELAPEQFLNLTQAPKIAPFGPKKPQTTN